MRSAFAAFTVSIVAAAAIAATPRTTVETVTVDALQPAAAFRPVDALGSTVDKEPLGSIPRLYSKQNVNAMLGAGWGWLSYRLFTELSSQDWHWNPAGTFSAGNRGYWTSSATPGAEIVDSYQYALPHRGGTTDQGNNASYSRIDDGDRATYWKSNPYLSHLYTHQSDSTHPQWVVVDLARAQRFDRVGIEWGNPYAIAYELSAWTGSDPFNDPGHGTWRTFANGTRQTARWVRILMTASSNTCDTHGASDRRNCTGYAIRELSVQRHDGNATTDLVHHAASQRQTPVFVSSVDPWHEAADRVNDQEQPGLDLIAQSGLVRGPGGTYPVPMLYSTPENAVAEVRYLHARHYPIRMIELGEEPDGQYVTPEDDAELYLQWARALHAYDSGLVLGGPVFSGSNDDIQAWRDASGNVSWLNRFLRYLRAHGGMRELAFMSFEHYPYDGCEHGAALQRDLVREQSLIRHMANVWRNDGLPASIPMYVTEANFSAVNFTETPMRIEGALWLADYMAGALQSGVSGVVYYQYEPVPLSRNSQCPGDYGNLTMFVAGSDARIRGNGAQYYAAQVLTKAWVEPGNGLHRLYAVATGTPLVTAYAVQRPDGSWSLLLDNKDIRAHTVRIVVHTPQGDERFSGRVLRTVFGPAQYVWHKRGAGSSPDPDAPPSMSTVPAAEQYDVPAQSLTVLRGTIGR